MAAKVEWREIEDLLKKIASGDCICLAIRRTWDELCSGNITFWVDGWLLVFFKDCEEVDYTDSVISPDGRFATYEDMQPADYPDGLEKALASAPKIIVDSDSTNKKEISTIFSG